MGLHTGDGALDADGEYVGADVHRAARVGGRRSRRPGPRSRRPTSALIAERRCPPGVRSAASASTGSRTSARSGICQLVIDGLQADFPPIRSLDRQPNNLPTQLTSFVGRDAELGEAGGAARRPPGC